MMSGCDKCMKVGYIIMLLLGIAFLLKDFGVWDFFGIQWYTALFLVWGIGMCGSTKCPDCIAMREGKMKASAKKK